MSETAAAKESRNEISAFILMGIALLLLVCGNTLPGGEVFSVSARSLSCPLFFFAAGFLTRPSRSVTEYIRNLKKWLMGLLIPLLSSGAFRFLALYFKDGRKSPVSFSDYIPQIRQYFLYPEQPDSVLWMLGALLLILIIYHLLHIFLRNDIILLCISAAAGAAGFYLVRKGITLPMCMNQTMTAFFFYAAGTCLEIRRPSDHRILIPVLFISAVLYYFILPHQYMDMAVCSFPHKFIFVKVLAGCTALAAACTLLNRLPESFCSGLSFAGRYPAAFLAVHELDYLFKNWFNFSSAPFLSLLFRYMIILSVSFGLTYFIHTVTDTVSAYDASVRDCYRNHKKISGLLFYICFTAAFTWLFLQTTMFRNYFSNIPGNTVFADLNRIIGSLFIMLAMFSLCGIKTRKQLVIICLILLTGTMHNYFVVTSKFFLLCFILASVTDRSFEPVPYISFFIGSAIMVLCYFASRAGYLHYLTYAPASHSFGIIYRTDHAAHALFLMMSYIAMRKNRLTAPEYAVQVLAMYFTWHYTAGKLSVLCMAALLAGSFLLQKFEQNGREIRLPEWLSLIHVFCCIATFLIVFLYAKGYFHLQSEQLSTFLSRYRFSAEAFRQYPVRLFGTNVAERGSDGLSIYSKTEYFAIDIMYVKLILRYGIMSLIMYLYIMTKGTLQSIRKRRGLFILIFMILAVNAMVEHHAIEYCYNIFILLPFASEEKEKEETAV